MKVLHFKCELEKEVEDIALLSHMRLFSTKRLLNKIGMMNIDDFIEIDIINSLTSNFESASHKTEDGVSFFVS